MKDLATKQTQNNIVTPVQLLNIAVDKGADIDKLQQLMGLQKEWEENEARKAYHLAVSQFKTESIEILKNKKVKFTTGKGETSYNHATLDHILEVTVPVLAKYGLSHHWTPAQGEGGRITIKCTLTHSSGHSEFVHISGPPDDSGAKNNIQRVGSTMTYLERYTFLAITGLAAKDQDDDGELTGERKGYSDGWVDSQTYYMACYKHKEVIENVKDALADDDLEAAAEHLYSLTNKELKSIRRAPTKGGIFTLEEMKKMDQDNNPAWAEARKAGLALNPDVDRSL